MEIFLQKINGLINFQLSGNWRYTFQSFFLTDTTGQNPAYWNLEHSYRLTTSHMMTHCHFHHTSHNLRPYLKH